MYQNWFQAKDNICSTAGSVDFFYYGKGPNNNRTFFAILSLLILKKLWKFIQNVKWKWRVEIMCLASLFSACRGVAAILVKVLNDRSPWNSKSSKACTG